MRTIIEIVACLIAGTLLGLITAESVARPGLGRSHRPTPAASTAPRHTDR
jgi:hypothetical protein